MLSEHDYKIFGEIEDIREKIKEKNIAVSVLDYGAGTPSENRTSSQMYKGVQKTISTKDLCEIGLKNNWAQALYSLVKENEPNTILEMGTCCGFSSIYMAKASLNSQIFTIEGDESVANIAKNNIDAAKCKNIIQYIGRFQDILMDVLHEIKNIDFAFIDGHHEKKATIEYFNIIKPYLSSRAIVVFDDISWSSGMQEAWDIIKNDSDIKEYEDLEKIGVCYFK